VKKCVLAAALLVLAGCSKNIDNPEAVKQGVVDYLKQRAPTMGLDMSAMDVNVGPISFEKDVARANVSFVPKGMTGGGGMMMNYVLERKDGKWVVKGRQVSPGKSHGDQPLPPEGLPPGHPPTDQRQ
jgi:hypothetical protein